MTRAAASQTLILLLHRQVDTVVGSAQEHGEAESLAFWPEQQVKVLLKARSGEGNHGDEGAGEKDPLICV